MEKGGRGGGAYFDKIFVKLIFGNKL